MNTNNIYYSMLRMSTEIDYEEHTTITHSAILKPVLVLVKSTSNGELIVKDLNSKKEYMIGIPLSEGQLFINPFCLLPFNYFDNVPNKLSKRKVLKIGNENLKEAEKTLKLKSDFSKDTIYKRYICKNNKFYVVTK